jgi:hypothetical protein
VRSFRQLNRDTSLMLVEHFADKVSPYGSRVTPINEDGQLDAGRAAVIHNGIHRCPDSPAGKENIIKQNHSVPFNRKRDVGLSNRQMQAMSLEIIAVEGDINFANRNFAAFDLLKTFGKFTRQIYSAGSDANKGEILNPLILLKDFVGNSCHSLRIPVPSRIIVLSHPCSPPVKNKEPFLRGWKGSSQELIKIVFIHLANLTGLS